MSSNGLLSLNTKQDIQPEKIFDLKEKLGEGSYGSVFKAVHKVSNSLVAIKKVPLDSDLQVIHWSSYFNIDLFFSYINGILLNLPSKPKNPHTVCIL